MGCGYFFEDDAYFFLFDWCIILRLIYICVCSLGKNEKENFDEGGLIRKRWDFVFILE